MLSRLVISGSRRVSAFVAPAFGNGLSLPSVVIPQRSFGVISSIRSNLNDKMEEKKQKNQGW